MTASLAATDDRVVPRRRLGVTVPRPAGARAGEAEAPGENARVAASTPASLPTHLARVERAAIRSALHDARNDLPAAAAMLGIGVRSLLVRLRRLSIAVPRARTHLPRGPRRGKLPDAKILLESRLMAEALRRSGGNATEAARLLGTYPSRVVRARRRKAALAAAEPIYGPLPNLLVALDQLEHRLVCEALHESRGNSKAAAAALGIARSTIFRWRRRYGRTEAESGQPQS